MVSVCEFVTCDLKKNWIQPMPNKRASALLAAVLIACIAAEVSRARRCAHSS